MMKSHTSQDLYSKYGLLAAVICYIISVLVHFSYFPLNGDEPRRAVVAIEMLHSGNYIRPTTMGWEYYNKPPVYNWLISFCMWITGSTSELPVRLPSLISLLAWGFCNYQIVKRLLNKDIALLSSIFLVTSFDIYFWGLSNGGEIDIFYSFIVYLQVMSILYFGLQKRWLPLFVLSYLFCSIGFLTKGFPSLLFQVHTISAFVVFTKSFRSVFRWQHLAGIAVLLALVGGYLYAYSFHSSPRILLADLLKEAFNKSAFGEYSERFLQKSLNYPFSFLKILLPWSLLLLLLFKKHTYRLWTNPVVRFSILFILFNIPVYWFTGHPRMRYAYMFVPFSMIILAYIFYHTKQEYPELARKVTRFGVIGLLLIMAAGIVAAPFMTTLNPALFIVAIMPVAFFVFAGRKKLATTVAFFAAGIVIMRFAFALLLIPARYDKTELKYDKEMALMAASNNFQPITIYHRADTLDLIIDLKVSKLHLGTIPAIPYIAYQMPYYYFRSSGQVVQFDTVLHENKSYIGFGSTLGGVDADIHYSFRDKNQNNDQIVLFTIPSTKQASAGSGSVKALLKHSFPENSFDRR